MSLDTYARGTLMALLAAAMLLSRSGFVMNLAFAKVKSASAGFLLRNGPNSIDMVHIVGQSVQIGLNDRQISSFALW